MASSEISVLVFYVNGKKVVEKNVDPETTLLQYLRNTLGLHGTKLGCGEGGCGSCTVMISRYDPQQKRIHHYSANACLAPVCSLHGMAVTTVEGIGSVKSGLHPVQERLVKSHGSQCGFCTPGIVMSMYTLLRNNPRPTVQQMEKTFEGNLCRCTGYRPILDGFRTFTKEHCQMGKDCCRNQTSSEKHNDDCMNKKLPKDSEFLPLDPSQDPIFPPELRNNPSFNTESLTFRGERVTWYRPTSLSELLHLRKQIPDAKLVVGNTEIGIEVKLKNMKYPVLIYTAHVPGLTNISHTADGLTIGASVTLADLDLELKECIQKYPEQQTRMFAAVVEMLRWFAGHQIRNVAGVGGNIITASPISDLNPLFLAAGATLEVQSLERGTRRIKMNGQFFTGYRKTIIRNDEVLLSISLPFTSKNEYFYGYKQAYRREDDTATVNAGIRVVFEDDTNVVKDMAFAYGGMAPVTAMATNTAAAVIGKKWDDSIVPDVCRWLADELPLAAGSPGGLEEYRRTLTTSFFFKFYLTVTSRIQHISLNGPSRLLDQGGVPSFHRDTTTSSQVYEEVADGQPLDDPLNRPLVHMAGLQQATGEAVYVDDIPTYTNELHMALVYSTVAHANILDMDPTEAMAMPGVCDFICHKDVPGPNLWGPVMQDDEVFASSKVVCQGQILGAVVATSQTQAQRAAKCVKVRYEELESIITITDAIKVASFFGEPYTIHSGNVDAAFNEADHVIEGEGHVGGQEHFYMETQGTIAIPKLEDDEIEIIASTQDITETQLAIAENLDVPYNRVTVKVKRLGGGFGGKEIRSMAISIPVAIAANKLGVPVRCMLDREEDMAMTGTRHPFRAKYKVGFTSEGRILALDLVLYSNAGSAMDLSRPVMERALLHCDNAYKIPNVLVTGYVCKTNLPSNTAYRGFGAPQSMILAEQWMSEVAVTLGLPPYKVRERNLYQDGMITHFNQELSPCFIQKCWDECIIQSDFHGRKAEVETFNRGNRWKKRGITVIPTKFGIAFPALRYANQAGALVHVYKDGSVLLTHGGIEMGQGLHTKMIQIASRTLQIPVSRIYISETGTNTVPNTSSSAASVTSDLNGMAILNACMTLLERLEPIKNANPDGSWDDWVKAAYFNRVSLSTTGFYKMPGIGYDFKSNSGNPFNYYTYGAACSEVEIDCLTGDHQVLRTDIVMDVGVSLNPAIDIGQIEGAFMQGYGLMMMEQQKISPRGFLYTRGPGTYKIPGFGDIPVQFNVSLLKGSKNEKAVYSSKGIGEPPLFLASTVLFAVKDAISSARSDAGYSGNFRLDSPATPERIRMACKDQFTEMFPPAEEGSYTPWFVDLAK